MAMQTCDPSSEEAEAGVLEVKVTSATQGASPAWATGAVQETKTPERPTQRVPSGQCAPGHLPAAFFLQWFDAVELLLQRRGYAQGRLSQRHTGTYILLIIALSAQRKASCSGEGA